MPVTLFLSPSTLVRSKDHILRMLPEARSYCDSSSLHYLLRWRGIHIPMGSFDLSESIGLAKDVFNRARQLSQRVVVVGGTASEWTRFRDYLISTFRIDRSKLFGTHGYHPNVLEVVLEMISEIRPEVLILGLGAPTQEYVASRCTVLFPGTEIFTCGAFITQTVSAGGAFYPTFFDRTHTRWLYRSIRQPYVITRIFTEYFRGFWLAARLGRRLCGANCRSAA